MKYFGSSMNGGRGGEFLEFLKISKKTPIGKKEKKTHSIFQCDQTNVSWFKIGGINFGSPVHGGVGVKFLNL